MFCVFYCFFLFKVCISRTDELNSKLPLFVRNKNFFYWVSLIFLTEWNFWKKLFKQVHTLQIVQIPYIRLMVHGGLICDLHTRVHLMCLSKSYSFPKANTVFPFSSFTENTAHWFYRIKRFRLCHIWHIWNETRKICQVYTGITREKKLKHLTSQDNDAVCETRFLIWINVVKLPNSERRDPARSHKWEVDHWAKRG